MNFIRILLLIFVTFISACLAESSFDSTCNPVEPLNGEGPVLPKDPLLASFEELEGGNSFVPESPYEMADKIFRRILVVKATAYNALEEQTDSTPTICAWGDTVRPGVIAISRDLEQLGLTRGKEVYVKGYGKKVVMDRMHRRKRNQIDLFMEEYDDAIQFGVRELEISWDEEVVHEVGS